MLLYKTPQAEHELGARHAGTERATQISLQLAHLVPDWSLEPHEA